jgi:hypothetical protein
MNEVADKADLFLVKIGLKNVNTVCGQNSGFFDITAVWYSGINSTQSPASRAETLANLG